jgi:hypothetical protein
LEARGEHFSAEESVGGIRIVIPESKKVWMVILEFVVLILEFVFKVMGCGKSCENSVAGLRQIL